ncbi:hypothetical protein H4W31_007236 [Plantactinospora soyae]|uniref:Uncharacterized protein n=1 Tax=Plantactinospora soyae TaxID=1544732 RepID=A0A927MBA8_9ACTN|nr:hypothetical protein [Plantactinospora soyae]
MTVTPPCRRVRRRAAPHRPSCPRSVRRGAREDLPPRHGVVAVQPDDQWFGDRLAPVGEQADRLDDAVGHGVAGGDPAEDVDEDAPYVGVAEDDLQAVRHHLGRGAAADVEEVGRLHPAELLARVGDHVECAHHQAGSVADDSHGSVELDVVEVLLGGPDLQRVGGADVDELRMSGLSEPGVVVQGHLAVQCPYRAVGELGQWVDLDQGGVLGAEDVPEPDQDAGHDVAYVVRQAGVGGQPERALPVEAGGRVDLEPGQRLRVLGRHLFDLDPALPGGQGEERALGPVEQQGDVVLVDDLAGLGDQHLVHGVALDVHAQDVGRDVTRRVRAVGQSDSAGLASAAGLHLGLDHYASADLGGGRVGLVRGAGDTVAADRYAVLGEEFLCLVLQQIHRASLLFDLRWVSPAHWTHRTEVGGSGPDVVVGPGADSSRKWTGPLRCTEEPGPGPRRCSGPVCRSAEGFRGKRSATP